MVFEAFSNHSIYFRATIFYILLGNNILSTVGQLFYILLGNYFIYSWAVILSTLGQLCSIYSWPTILYTGWQWFYIHLRSRLIFLGSRLKTLCAHFASLCQLLEAPRRRTPSVELLPRALGVSKDFPRTLIFWIPPGLWVDGPGNR